MNRDFYLPPAWQRTYELHHAFDRESAASTAQHRPAEQTLQCNGTAYLALHKRKALSISQVLCLNKKKLSRETLLVILESSVSDALVCWLRWGGGDTRVSTNGHNVGCHQPFHTSPHLPHSGHDMIPNITSQSKIAPGWRGI